MTSPAPVTTLPPLTADEAAHSRRVIEHIRAFIASAGRCHRLRRVDAARAVCAGPGVLQRGRDQVRRRRRFRHRARSIEPVLALPRPAGRRRAATTRAATSSSSARARAAWRPTCSTELLALDAVPDNYYILEVSADLAARQRERLAALPGGSRAARAVVRPLARAPACAAWCWPTKCSTPCRWNASYCAVSRARSRCASWAWSLTREGFELVREAGQAGARSRGARTSSSRCPGRCRMVTCRKSAWRSSRGWPVFPRSSTGASRCSSITACRARSSITPSASTVRCAATSGIAHTTILSSTWDCRTSPPGWISRASPRPPTAPSSRCWASPRRPHSSSVPAWNRCSPPRWSWPRDDSRRQAQLAGEARRLMLPGEMGEIFKVIGLGKQFGQELVGFSTRMLDL